MLLNRFTLERHIAAGGRVGRSLQVSNAPKILVLDINVVGITFSYALKIVSYKNLNFQVDFVKR